MNGTSVQNIIAMIVILRSFCGIFSSGDSSLDLVIVFCFPATRYIQGEADRQI